MTWKKKNYYNKFNVNTKRYYEPLNWKKGNSSLNGMPFNQRANNIELVFLDLKTSIGYLLDAIKSLQRQIEEYKETNNSFELYLDHWVKQKNEHAKTITKDIVLAYIRRLTRCISSFRPSYIGMEQEFIIKVKKDLQEFDKELKDFYNEINPENGLEKINYTKIYSTIKEITKYLFPTGNLIDEIFTQLRYERQFFPLQELLVCPPLVSEGYYENEPCQYPGLSRTLKNILREITVGMTIDLRRTIPPQELGYKSNDRVPVVYLDDISILFSGNLKHKELEVFDKLCEHIGFKIYNKGETKHLFLKEAVIELLIKKNLATYREKGEGRRVLELFIDEYTFFQYYLAICSKNKKNMDRGLAQWIVTVLANITLNMLLDHRLTNNNVFKPVLHERWFLIKVLPPLANIIGFFIQGAEWADLIPQTKERRREAMDGLMSIQSNRIQPIIQILVNSINTNSSTSTNIDYFNDEFWNSKQNKNTTERLDENEF